MYQSSLMVSCPFSIFYKMQDNRIVHYQHKFVEDHNNNLERAGAVVAVGVVVLLLQESTCIRFLGNHCCIDKHVNHMWRTYYMVCCILPLLYIRNHFHTILSGIYSVR